MITSAPGMINIRGGVGGCLVVGVRYGRLWRVGVELEEAASQSQSCSRRGHSRPARAQSPLSRCDYEPHTAQVFWITVQPLRYNLQTAYCT